MIFCFLEKGGFYVRRGMVFMNYFSHLLKNINFHLPTEAVQILIVNESKHNISAQFAQIVDPLLGPPRSYL